MSLRGLWSRFADTLAGISPDPPSLTSKRRWCEVHQIRADEGVDACQVALGVRKYRQPLVCRFVRGLWVIQQIESGKVKSSG